MVWLPCRNCSHWATGFKRGDRQAVWITSRNASNSVAILNHDDSLIATAATVWQGETLTYGLEGGIQGQLIDNEISVGECNCLYLSGRHNASNFLAAGCGKSSQIDWSPLTAGLKLIFLMGDRSGELQNDVVVLDESYNAAPEAMTAALNLLVQTPESDILQFWVQWKNWDTDRLNSTTKTWKHSTTTKSWCSADFSRRCRCRGDR